MQFLNIQGENMKKRILATLVAGTVLATSAYAFHKDGEWGPQCRKFAKDSSFGNRGFFRGGFMKRGFRRNGMIMPYLSELDLTDSQKEQMYDIMKKLRDENYKPMSDFFTDEKFDKSGYEKALKSRFDNRFKIKLR